MARRAVDVAGTSLTVSFDEPAFAGMRWWGVARYQMMDEHARQPIGAPATLSTGHPKVVARNGDDGLVGAVARPWDLLNPLLRNQLALDVRVSAPGYLPRRLSPRLVVRRLQLAANASTDTLSVITAPTGLEPGQRLIIGDATGPGLAFEFATIRSVDVALQQIRLTGTLSQTYVAGPNTFVVPDEFTIDASARGQFELHRRPTLIAGRVTELVGVNRVPVAGAEVRVREVWRLNVQPVGAPAPDGPQAAWRPPVGLLVVPLYADFPVAGTQVLLQNRGADPLVAPKQLDFAVEAGTSELVLSDGVGLTAGDLIAIDTGRPDSEELIQLDAVAGALAPADPVRVRLMHPLRLAHRRAAVVRRLVPPPGASPARALLQEGLEGDPLLLLDMTGGASEGQIEVVHPGPPVVRCHHRVRLYRATANADGVFHLPVARASRLVIGAFGPPPGFLKSSPPVILEPDYAVDENRLDCLIT